MLSFRCSPRERFKFVTFALDSKTSIRREDKGVVRTTLGKAANGMLDLDGPFAAHLRL